MLVVFSVLSISWSADVILCKSYIIRNSQECFKMLILRFTEANT